MKVSVIIPIYNAAATIAACLKSLALQDRIPDQILLVDNGSKDDTVNIINKFIEEHRSLNIVLLKEDKKGAGCARNKGLKSAQGDIVAFTDSDCIVEKKWLENILCKFEQTNADAIGGMVKIYQPKTCSEKLQALSWDLHPAYIDSFIEYPWQPLFGKMLGTLNCAFRKHVFEKIGGFDEELNISGEDMDFTLRAFSAGFKILVWSKDVLVYHMPRAKYFSYLKQIFEYRIILPFLLKKHFNNILLIDLPIFGLKKFSFPWGVAFTREFLGILFLLFIGVFFQINVEVLSLIISLLFLKVSFYIISRRNFLEQKIGAGEIVVMIFLEFIKKSVSEYGRLYGVIKYKSVYL
ncbi:MAG: glycosyltransferase [Candidatus Omnitrophota bacterium]